MKKAFVTGATGFIGKNLVPRLLAEGFQVTCLARHPIPSLFDKSVIWKQGDILDNSELLQNLIKGHEAVYHLAGLIGYKKSLYEAMMTVNKLGTANLLKAAIGSDVENFIYLSSVAAVGASIDANTLLNENSNYNLSDYNFGYFQSKHEAEELLKSISNQHSINTFILNPSTIYGAGDALKGSRGVQVKVAKGNFPFYPPGGVNVVHIDDVIDSIIKVSKFGKKNERYIIANKNFTLKELFNLIAHFGGVKSPQFSLSPFALLALGYTGELLTFLGARSAFSLENARVASFFHWFDNHKSITNLGNTYRSSESAVEDSVRWIYQHLN